METSWSALPHQDHRGGSKEAEDHEMVRVRFFPSNIKMEDGYNMEGLLQIDNIDIIGNQQAEALFKEYSPHRSYDFW